MASFKFEPSDNIICALTISIPVISSVIVCSTCIRGFTSMKKNSFVFISIRNSTVPAHSYLTCLHIAVAISHTISRCLSFK